MELRIALLGPGDCGKSTLYNQIVLLGKPHNSKELHDNVLDVYLSNFADLLRTVSFEYPEFFEIGKNVHESHDIAIQWLLNMGPEKLLELWHDKRVQAVWEQRDNFQFSDNLPFLFDNVTCFMDKESPLTKQFFLRCKTRTTGISTLSLELEGKTIEVTDTGGQRSERRKWLKMLENIDGIIYVASISDFNQVLWEADTVNRWEETTEIFKRLVEIPSLYDIPIVLLLNKVDLLEEKLKRFEEQGVNLNEYFPTLRLGFNYDVALEAILDHFQSELLRLVSAPRIIGTYVISAIDTQFQNMFKGIVKKFLTALNL